MTVVPGLPEQELAVAGLTITRDGGVLNLILSRPEARNAQTPSLWWALAKVGEWIGQGESGVRAVIFSGLGKSFSAGMDLRMLQPDGIEGQGSIREWMSGPSEAFDATIAGFQQGFAIWRELPVVSIAAVQGYAIGAGFQLALAADVIVCGEDASFCMKEPTLGLVPDLAGTKPLVEAVGYRRALEICVSGRFVPAAEAVSLGIAIEAVPVDDLPARAQALAATLSAALPGAIGETKALLRDAGGRTHREQQAAERGAQLRRFTEIAAAMSAAR